MNKTSQLNAFNTVGQNFTQQFANKSFRVNDLQASLLSFLKQNGLNNFITYGSSLSSQLNSADNSQFYGNFKTAGPLTDCEIIIHTGQCTAPNNVIQSINVAFSFNGKNVTLSIPGSRLTQKRTSSFNNKFIKYAQSSVARAIDYIMRYFDYEIVHATKNITLNLNDINKIKAITYHKLMDVLASTAEYKINLTELNRLFGNDLVEVGREVERLIIKGKFASHTPEFLSLVNQFAAKIHNASRMMVTEKRAEVLRILAHDLNINLSNPSINHADDVAIYTKIQEFLRIPGNPNMKSKILGDPGSVESRTYLSALEQMFREQGGINNKNAHLYKRYWNASKKETGYKGTYMGIKDAPKAQRSTAPNSNIGATTNNSLSASLPKGRMPQFFKDFLHSYVFSLKAFRNRGLGALWSACMLITLASNVHKLDAAKGAAAPAKNTLEALKLDNAGYPCWFITMPYIALAGWLTEVTGSGVISYIWQQINNTSSSKKPGPKKSGNAPDGYAPVNPLLQGPIGKNMYELERKYPNKFKKPQVPNNHRSNKNVPVISPYQNQSSSQNNIGDRQQQIENGKKIDEALFGDG